MTSRRWWEVLMALSRAELRDSRDLTVMGFLKWLLEPVAYVLIYFILIGTVLRRGQYAYPLFLMAALLPWRYFQGVTMRGMSLLNAYGNIVSTRAFPRWVLPVVVLMSEGASFLLSLLLLIPMMALYRIPPTPALLWIPVIILALALVSAGPTYLFTLFGLYFPDYRGVVQGLIRIGFFVSTGLVAARRIAGEHLALLLQANPLSGIFDALRSLVLYGRSPEPWQLLYPAAVGAALLVLGVSLYRWRESEFAKEV